MVLSGLSLLAVSVALLVMDSSVFPCVCRFRLVVLSGLTLLAVSVALLVMDSKALGLGLIFTISSIWGAADGTWQTQLFGEEHHQLFNQQEGNMSSMVPSIVRRLLDLCFQRGHGFPGGKWGFLCIDQSEVRILLRRSFSADALHP